MKKWVEFVEDCDKTILNECKNYEYLVMGLYSEIGEVAGKLKKHIRGDFPYEKLIESVKLEIGDCLWYVAMIDKYCNHSSDDVISVVYLSNVVHKSIGTSFAEIGRVFQATELSVPVSGGAVVPSDIYNLISSLERVAASFDVDLVTCAEAVIEKLSKRSEIGTIKGDGDGVEDRTLNS